MAPPEPGPEGVGVGVSSEHRSALDDYVASLVDALQGRQLTGLHVVVDCGNGAAFRAAPTAFRALGATVDVIHASPDGVNINAGCGSTHPGDLQEAVLVAARRRRARVRRRRRSRDRGRRTRRARRRRRDPRGHRARPARPQAPAGRRRRRHRDVEPRVAPCARSRTGSPWSRPRSATATCSTSLEQRNLTLGGEQSGHVIFADHATTGDGTLTGILLLDIMARRRAVALRAGVGARRGCRRSSATSRSTAARACGATPRSGAGSATSTTSSATTAGSSCGRRAPSRSCGSWWSRPTPTAAAEAADRLVELVEHGRFGVTTVAGGGRVTPPRAASATTLARRHGSHPLASNLLLMCGIVGVVRRRATRAVPDAGALVAQLDDALTASRP